MRIIDGQRYLTTGDLGAYVNRSPATIAQWCKYSDILAEKNEERLIPKPLIMNGQRLFTPEQALVVKGFVESKGKYGLMAEFNRKRLGKRGQEIKKRVRDREKEQEKIQVEMKEKELEVALSKVNRAVDFKDRFKHIKKNL
ncbi:hypothetical protein BTO30_16185 [Domibacillus antri]|uniref:Uncharacterized protein n=1 Tax=Domibacillus antri TaxID=1714264 RepID=A0A1Q8Q1L9_9BACI|nr:hypothetical protein [Domibacillus antri]OLN21217.1 hypothetical protein BTO30_16185 [Domibacillus antri]